MLPSLVLVAFAYVAVNPFATAKLSSGAGIPFVVLAAAMAALVYAISFLVLAAPQTLAGGQGVSAGKSGREPLLTDEECQWIAVRVKEVLDSDAFLETGLSLRKLAGRLGLHPNRVSFAINHVFNKSFSSLVNDYRLNYFLARTREGALEGQTILDLALESGFPSKSTFNRVFKDAMGLFSF